MRFAMTPPAWWPLRWWPLGTNTTPLSEEFKGESRIESKYLDFSLVTLTKASDSDMVSKQSGGAYMWTEYAAESELQ
jgi:hypothetical protein